MLVIWFWSETRSAFREKSNRKSEVTLNGRWFKNDTFLEVQQNKYFSCKSNGNNKQSFLITDIKMRVYLFSVRQGMVIVFGWTFFVVAF